MAKKTTVEIDPRVVEIKVQMNNLIEDIREQDVKIVELQEMYRVHSEELKNRFEDKQLLLQTKKDKLKDNLRFLFEQVPQQETKTQRKVMLLNGDVVVKKSKNDFTKDADKLLEWAKATGREDLITRKETLSFKWTDFKKRLVAVDEGIVDCETGEYLHIEGLEPITKSEELEIKY
ncbi:MAG: host-nuclease inhibitor Gam family protein [Cellulosilyticaceae bacterium]